MAVDPELVRRAMLARELYTQQPALPAAPAPNASPYVPQGVAPAAMPAPVAPVAAEPAPVVPAGEALGEAGIVADARKAVSAMRERQPEPWRTYADPNEQIRIVNENLADQDVAARAASEAQSEGAREKAALLDERAKETEAQGKRAEENLTRYQTADDKGRAELSELDKQLAAIEIRDRRTTADHTRQAIARALAAVGTGFARMGGDTQSNYSNDLEAAINAQVEQDLRMQVANANNKREGRKAKLDELALARNRFDGEQDQLKFAHALTQQRFASSLEAQAARTDDRVQAAQYQQTAAKLRTAADVSKMEIGDKEEAKRAQQQAAAAAAANVPFDYKTMMSEDNLRAWVETGTAPVAAAMALADLEKTRASGQPKPTSSAAAGDPITADRKVANPTLWNSLPQTEQQKFRAGETATRELVDVVTRLQKLRAENGVAVGIPGTAAYRQADTLGTQLKLKLKTTEALGTWDKGSAEVLGDITGDPTAWWYNAPEEKLQVIADTVQAAQEKLAANVGASTAPTPGQAPPPRNPQDKINQALTAPGPQSLQLNDVKATLGFTRKGAP